MSGEVTAILLFALFAALSVRSIVRMVRYSPSSGSREVPGESSEPPAAQRLRDLASLRDQGLVSADEYESKKAEILAEV